MRFHGDILPVADMCLIYITEAHAQNEWPIGSRLRYNQPRQTQERSNIVNEYIRDTQMNIPLLIDPVCEHDSTLNNPFETIYAPWPIRYYIIYQNKLTYIANPKECSFLLSDLKDALCTTLGVQSKDLPTPSIDLH